MRAGKPDRVAKPALWSVEDLEHLHFQSALVVDLKVITLCSEDDGDDGIVAPLAVHQHFGFNSGARNPGGDLVRLGTHVRGRIHRQALHHGPSGHVRYWRPEKHSIESRLEFFHAVLACPVAQLLRLITVNSAVVAV